MKFYKTKQLGPKLVYSQIWLKLLWDDRQIFNIFLWIIASLATNKNSKKKKNTTAQ
jgi:hypothetical protein